MKTLQIIITFFVILIFEKCTSVAHINGRYSNVYAEIARQEFKFTQAPNTFEYYATTEGMIRRFSFGAWMQNKKAILLNGFDDKNINVLNVEGKAESYSDGNRDKIIVQYKDNPLDTFIKVDLIVNGVFKVRLPGDTTFLTDAINTLQVKSYFVHEGFSLGAPSSIDTLYSTEIKVGNMSSQHKMISLKFDVEQKDFYRIKFTDSLTVKNNRTLIWNNKEFKKIKQL
jgi:hypothetical protein